MKLYLKDDRCKIIKTETLLIKGICFWQLPFHKQTMPSVCPIMVAVKNLFLFEESYCFKI